MLKKMFALNFELEQYLYWQPIVLQHTLKKKSKYVIFETKSTHFEKKLSAERSINHTPLKPVILLSSSSSSLSLPPSSNSLQFRQSVTSLHWFLQALARVPIHKRHITVLLLFLQSAYDQPCF